MAKIKRGVCKSCKEPSAWCTCVDKEMTEITKPAKAKIGTLSDLKLYKTALTPKQVKQIYKEYTTKPKPFVYLTIPEAKMIGNALLLARTELICRWIDTGKKDKEIETLSDDVVRPAHVLIGNKLKAAAKIAKERGKK